MRKVWQEASAGNGAVLLISGEAGIGKTRLATEFTRWAERLGYTVAVAQCYSTEGSLAYAPIVAWLRAAPLRANLEKVDNSWLAELARLLPELAATHPNLQPSAQSGESVAAHPPFRRIGSRNPQAA